MILYHYTSAKNFRAIREAGELLMTQAPVHPRKPGRGVVWLTSHATIAEAKTMGLDGDAWAKELRDWPDLDKTRMRITVDVPRTYVHRWRDWAPRNGGHPGFLDMLRTECADYGSWWVSTKPIPRAQWVEVIDTSVNRGKANAIDAAYAGQLDDVVSALKEAQAPPARVPTVTPSQLGFRKLH